MNRVSESDLNSEGHRSLKVSQSSQWDPSGKGRRLSLGQLTPFEVHKAGKGGLGFPHL